jgi:putative oxidoreductase
MNNASLLIARIFLGHIFLLAGINKIGAYEGTQGYMESMGVPGELLFLVIVLEIVGGLAVILGWQVRWASWALAAFTIVAGLIFHGSFDDQMQSIQFMKNVAIAGGFLALATAGAGAYSVEAVIGNRDRTAASH